METGEILKQKPLGMQVCVPDTWDEKQILAFCEEKNPCGTQHGWSIAKDGDSALMGDPAKVVCASNANRVHYVIIC